MPEYNRVLANSNHWPRDWAIHVGAQNIWPIVGADSLPAGASIRAQVRQKKESTAALLSVAVDVSANTALIGFADTAPLVGLSSAWMVWDVMIDSVPYRYRQGEITVEPDGSGQALAPTLVDLGTFQDLLDEATALVQQFVDDHGTMAAALATATAQAALATSERITVEGLEVVVNNTIAAFNAQHGDFDTAIAAAEAQATLATTERQAAEAAAASLNAAAGFALEQLGAQNQDLTSSLNVIGVEQIRYLDLADYGASYRAGQHKEYNVVLRSGSIAFYNLDGALEFTITRQASLTPARNWWRSSRHIGCTASSSGFVFAGVINATINGILFIDLITGELRRLGEDADHTNRDLFIGDDLTTDMPRAWVVDNHLTDGFINDLAARILPGTVFNQARGVPDPTLAAATEGGLTMVRPNPTLDTPHITNIAWGGGLESVALNDRYVAASVAGGYFVYVWRHTVDDSSSGSDSAMAIGITTPASLLELNITGVDFDAAGLLVVSHPTGLSLFKLHDDENQILWRHKGAAFDTGWQRARSVLAVVGNTEEVNYASGDLGDNGVGASVAKVEGTAGALTTEAVAAGADRLAMSGFVHDDSYYTGTLLNAVGVGDFHLRVIGKHLGSDSVFSIGDAFTAALPVGGFLLHITGALGMNIYLNSTITTASNVVPLGIYSCIDLVRDGGVLKIYVDGEYITEAPMPDDLTATGLKFGDGFWSKAEQLAAVSLSLGAPDQATLKWMFEQDKHSYRDNAGVLIDVDAEPNDVDIDGRHTYTAHDGVANDATLIKWSPEYVALERISPMSLHSSWAGSSVSAVAANEGHLLIVGDETSNYRPAITLAELAQQRRDYVQEKHGIHTAMTLNDGFQNIWNWPIPADVSGAKFAIDIWGHDASGDEVARYYADVTIYRDNNQAAVVDDVAFTSPASSPSATGFRNDLTGGPSFLVLNDVFILRIHGTPFPAPGGAFIRFFWSAQITKLS